MAKLYFRYGAMNSGKSAHLLMTAHNYQERGQTVLVLKPTVDTRELLVIGSRCGLGQIPATPVGPEDSMTQLAYRAIPKSRSGLDCILVDEAQFLTPEQVEQLTTLVDVDGIPVICYGLRADFQGNLFPGSQKLMALADSIEEMKTICWCGKKAIMNARLDDQGKVVYQGEQVQVGYGYVSLCRKHWHTGETE